MTAYALAACVLYHHTPVGNTFTAGLDEPTASFLQQVASLTVAGYKSS